MSHYQSKRLYHLDAVRAFSLLLGIVFHASLSFMPIFIGWAVMDVSTSSVVNIFALVAHSFRMELFFLIAGFFSHMKYHQLGSNVFLSSRLIRIGIPFFIGWFILRPLIVSGWTLGGDSMRGDVDYGRALSSAKDVIYQLPDNFLTGTHLWFLYYLLVITIGVLVIRQALTLNKALYHALRHSIDTLATLLCRSKWAVIPLAVVTAPCLEMMNHWGVDTPDKSLLPHSGVMILYSIFFIFGWVLNRLPESLAAVSKISWPLTILTLLSIMLTVGLSDYQMQHSHTHYSIIKVGFSLSYSLMMWSLVFLTLGVFNAVIKGPNRIISYLADASYWLYLAHLPLVIYLQVAFAELSLHWLIKWVSISALTLISSLVMYELFVRTTFIGKLLNGRK